MSGRKKEDESPLIREMQAQLVRLQEQRKELEQSRRELQDDDEDVILHRPILPHLTGIMRFVLYCHRFHQTSLSRIGLDFTLPNEGAPVTRSIRRRMNEVSDGLVVVVAALSLSLSLTRLPPPLLSDLNGSFYDAGIVDWLKFGC